MKCFHCGAEIEDGSITCSHCGNPLEVITDIFSDNEVLVEAPPQEDTSDDNTGEEIKNPVDVLSPEMQAESVSSEKTDTKPQKDPDMIEKKTMYIILGIVSAVFVVLLILMAIFWRKPAPVEEVVVEETGYDDVVKMIEDALARQNYGDAMECCAQALTFGECDEYYIYKYYLRIYNEIGNENKSLETLMMLKGFASDTGNVNDLTEWYEDLLNIYSGRNDTYNIGELINEIEDSFVGIDKNRLLKPFIPAEPVFSAVPDPAYPGDRIYISSPDGSHIFMGKVSKKSGNDTYLSLYHGEGLPLKSGRNEYVAVCENQYGLKSNTVNFSYVLKTVYNVDMPEISPVSGEYKEETFVEIEVPVTFKAYYCWDGDPDTESDEYTEKLEMLEGNHVFSAILVDMYGNISKIQRMNYIYIPEKDPEDEEEEISEVSETAGKDEGKDNNGGTKIIKDAEDTPVYHGNVKEPEKDEDEGEETGDRYDNDTVSGNEAVSGNAAS
ncbi:MAG: zinc ribbon domain-containing protein [Lachnospiraceae bacterium]|nr:zinc ribbon domain-containing protein [Lachnospiraceae bacterium]